MLLPGTIVWEGFLGARYCWEHRGLRKKDSGDSTKIKLDQYGNEVVRWNVCPGSSSVQFLPLPHPGSGSRHGKSPGQCDLYCALC